MQNLDTLKSLAEQLPDTHKANALKLIEEMGTLIEGISDEPVAWKPGFLRLVQGTTDRGSIPKGTAIGEFVLGEEKVEQPMRFIPLRTWDSRQYWDPDQTNNKMLCWSPDSKLGSMYGDCRSCSFKDWKEDGTPAECGKSKTSIAISADFSKVFQIQFSKSNYTVGTELEGIMRKAGVMPYARTYGLTSATSTKAKNVENYKIEVLDDKLRKTDDALIPFLKELFNIMGADRKALIDAFYESAHRRQEALALSGNAPATAITNQPTTSAEGETQGTQTVVEAKAATHIPVKANKGAVSELATTFKL